MCELLVDDDLDSELETEFSRTVKILMRHCETKILSCSPSSCSAEMVKAIIIVF
jgi:hypothetical protein